VTVHSLLRFELATAARGRAVTVVAAGFALASLVVALAGLSAGGIVTVQGFARTSVSLLQLVVWTVPMLALLTGAVAGADTHDIEFLVALPVSRQRLVLARWLAHLVALGGALLAGLGLAGLVLAALAGATDAARYLGLVGVAVLLLGATLALGLWIGVVAGNRLRAVAAAALAWLVLVIGADLVAITLLAVLPAAQAGWGLSLLLLADPVDSARALGIALFQATTIAGPAEAALRRVLGGPGAWLLAAGLLAWTVAPLAFAARRFGRSDL
jgi:Cu-processing system permease protein